MTVKHQYVYDGLSNMLAAGLVYPAIIMHAGAFILPLPMQFRGHTVVEYLLAAFSMLFYLYLSLGSMSVIYKLSRGNHPFRMALDTVLLTVPLLGPALHNLALGRYCFGFLMLYQCGVSMEKAAGFAAGLTGNAAVSAIFKGCVRSVRQGLPV